MSDEANNATNETVAPKSPYEEMAFSEFLKHIGNANLPNWSIVAEALGVSRATIWRWRQTPEAQAAIANAIEENLRKMAEAGANDWRMYRDKLKMLGVADKQTLEHELGEGVGELLNELESKTDYGKFGQKANGQVVADNPPIQDKE